MPGAAASPFAFWMIAIWWAGVVLLGLALVYAVVRAGRLRGDERTRLDQVTQAMVDEETKARAVSDERAAQAAASRPGPRRNVSSEFALPGAVAILAILLMILATAKSSEPANRATTTGQAPSQQAPTQAVRPGSQQQPVQAQEKPGNEPGSDSARGSQEPLTKRQ